jgi:hypothetical protein
MEENVPDLLFFEIVQGQTEEIRSVYHHLEVTQEEIAY